MAREDTAEQQIKIPAGAVGFRLRRICGNWWLRLFSKSDKNVGDYGPFDWAEVADAQAELQAKGLADIERELGSRGK